MENMKKLLSVSAAAVILACSAGTGHGMERTEIKECLEDVVYDCRKLINEVRALKKIVSSLIYAEEYAEEKPKLLQKIGRLEFFFEKDGDIAWIKCNKVNAKSIINGLQAALRDASTALDRDFYPESLYNLSNETDALIEETKPINAPQDNYKLSEWEKDVANEANRKIDFLTTVKRILKGEMDEYGVDNSTRIKRVEEKIDALTKNRDDAKKILENFEFVTGPDFWTYPDENPLAIEDIVNFS